MRKGLLMICALLLASCSTKDEYGVNPNNYENIIHCEVSDNLDGFSRTYIEQIYGNGGVIDYVYSEKLEIFQNPELMNNVENVEEVSIDGYSVCVKVDHKNGAIDTITRFDYSKLSYRELVGYLKDENYSENELETEEKIARDMSILPTDYCKIVK